MDRSARLIAVAVLAAPTLAQALYADAPVPEGIAKTASDWIGRASQSSRVTSGLWIGQTTMAGGGVATGVGVTAAVSTRAAGAVAAAARVALNPLISIPLTIAWMCLENQICYDNITGKWNAQHEVAGIYWNDGFAAYFTSQTAACQSGIGKLPPYNGQPPSFTGNIRNAGSVTGYCQYTRVGVGGFSEHKITKESGTIIETSEATETDWEEVETELQPLPDEVANEQPQGVIVEDPVMDPERQVIPTGEPYPGADPDAPWRQPATEFLPSPTPTNPWRYDHRTTERDADNPNTPEDEGDDTSTPGTPSEEVPDLCALHPDIVACQKLGDLEPEVIPTQVVPLAITPDGGWATAGECPGDHVLHLAHVTLPVPFTLLCTAGDFARPIVIGVAWVCAVFVFLGIARRS